MGACYSTPARGGKDTYVVCPTDMPQLSTDQCSTPSLHKPYGGRYGLQPAASLASNSVAKPSNMNRFGFKQGSKRSDANSNPTKRSNDSIQSTASSGHKGSGSTDSQRRNKRPLAYNPKDGDKWRMIDDDSSSSAASRRGKTGSPTKSIQSTTSTLKDVSGTAEDIINANVVQPAVVMEQRGTEKKSTTSRLSRFRGQFSRSHTLPQMEKKVPIAKDAPKASQTTVKKTKTSSGEKPNNGNRFLRRAFFKTKSVPDKSSQNCGKLSQSASADTAALQSTSTVAATCMPKSASQPHATRPTLPNLGNPVLQQKLVEKSQNLPVGNAPIAMIDSLETTSVGSLDADDLMLSVDVQLEDSLMESWSENRSESKSESRPRSRERHDEKKPPLLRRHTEGSMKKQKEAKQIEAEPLQELATLLTQKSW